VVVDEQPLGASSNGGEPVIPESEPELEPAPGPLPAAGEVEG
jgi:hypothetical protein